MGEKKAATDVALLAPVPLVHLTSAAKEPRVAFATKNWKLFSELEDFRRTLPEDVHIAVYIYATDAGRFDGKVSYRASYVELIHDKWKVKEFGYRPESTESDTDTGEVFWVVEDLRELPHDRQIGVGAFTGLRNKAPYGSSFAPRGPLLVKPPF